MFWLIGIWIVVLFVTWICMALSSGDWEGGDYAGAMIITILGTALAIIISMVPINLWNKPEWVEGKPKAVERIDIGELEGDFFVMGDRYLYFIQDHKGRIIARDGSVTSIKVNYIDEGPTTIVRIRDSEKDHKDTQVPWIALDVPDNDKVVLNVTKENYVVTDLDLSDLGD